MIEKEIWKPVYLEKFKEKYIVSNFGNIKNKLTGKILSDKSIRSGYKSVRLDIPEYSKTFKIHILVGKTFLENPSDPKMININHKDGNKLNNKLDNLEWISPRGNVIHALETGLIKPYERKIDQYDLDGNFIKTYDSGQKAANDLGCWPCSIAKVCKGRQETAGGFKWKYHEILEGENINSIKPNKIVPINDFPDYLVTDDGRVYTKKMKKYMKLHKNADGYLTVQLCKVVNGIRIKKDFLVHRLVALMHLPNYDNKPEINHINGIKTDNNLSNLEWNTQSENQLHKNKLKNKKHI